MADVNRYRSLDMRYFFHAVGTKCIHEDENGEEFDNDEDAAAYGAVIANELSDGGILNMMYILVVDEEDKEVSRSPIKAYSVVPGSSPDDGSAAFEVRAPS